MVLVRPVPHKHSDSGIFYLCSAVPDALKPIAGKSMEKVSLGTRDPIEACIRHAEWLADLEQRWAYILSGGMEWSASPLGRPIGLANWSVFDTSLPQKT